MTIPASKLRLLSHEERLKTSGPVHRIMVFDARGTYPGGTWRVPNGFFHADVGIAFSVVLGESWQEHDSKVPYSEFDWASPQELRLLTSLILCEVMDEGYLRLYPYVSFGPQLDRSGMHLESDETVAAVRALLFELMDQVPGVRNDFSRMPECRGKTYELARPETCEMERLGRFWHALGDRNYVLMRGVYALMKSDMLQSHYEFYEEAVTSAYIALEASFVLVCRDLKASGTLNPTAHDAALWVHQHFNAPYGLPMPDPSERFFSDFYEGRIMTMHPASRFGDVPYAPLMHDDLCHLRPWLRQLFAYLVLREHDPGFVKAVRQAERFRT